MIERLLARRANSTGRIDTKALPAPPLYVAVPCTLVDVSERALGITFPVRGQLTFPPGVRASATIWARRSFAQTELEYMVPQTGIMPTDEDGIGA